MRTVTLALLTGVALNWVPAAHAADLDYGVLRGSDYEPASTEIDWNGGYFGAHAGYSSAALGFNNAFKPIVASALSQTYFESEMNASGLLQTHSTRTEGVSYGAFAGWNYQFDETVIGVEVDYTNFGRTGASYNYISRSMVGTDGYFRSVGLEGTSSTRLEDFGTIRARAGYTMGAFLPFVTGGLAIGRAQVADQVKIQAAEYDQTTYRANLGLSDPRQAAVVNHSGYSSFNAQNPGRSTLADPITYGTSKTKVVGGIALGAGLEYALTQNIILRGEYQYVLFNDFDGHKVNLNTVRGGAAVKF
ncbi:outer membrane protein [Methylobacterium sp. E-045]|uniref:outer membrane protein n=1 Tax=Methylobacterium sp. E-045 TaxID=2836575 RepID=UPI001FB960E3|nr:outer membrane beta-barrel protein [Methylobacterium sp. E-045]MCJ2132351.1 outer membrane beta-barrel protein [Methylobacterium sp. E-045]